MSFLFSQIKYIFGSRFWCQCFKRTMPLISNHLCFMNGSHRQPHKTFIKSPFQKKMHVTHVHFRLSTILVFIGSRDTMCDYTKTKALPRSFQENFNKKSLLVVPFTPKWSILCEGNRGHILAPLLLIFFSLFLLSLSARRKHIWYKKKCTQSDLAG